MINIERFYLEIYYRGQQSISIIGNFSRTYNKGRSVFVNSVETLQYCSNCGLSGKAVITPPVESTMELNIYIDLGAILEPSKRQSTIHFIHR